MKRIAILHGAGYVGGELIRLVMHHPDLALLAVTSRAFAGKPLSEAHPQLSGHANMSFVTNDEIPLREIDAILLAAEHGHGVRTVLELLEAGFEGPIVDLSADFRFADPALYPRWFGFEHPAPELLDRFTYGLAEVYPSYPEGTRYIANPGCFATGISLALWPLGKHLKNSSVAVCALTGASGSGAKPSATTHFPTREGNVRAYKILDHQHLPEIREVAGRDLKIAFVPVSAPWTRGIWGTCTVELPEETSQGEVNDWFRGAYPPGRFVRLWENQLPELRYAVYTPYCDIGWVVRDGHLVVGFAIDNLLKGAASQAVQNLNLMLGLRESAGLLPGQKEAPVHM